MREYKNMDKLDKVVWRIYRRLYKEAEPSADFEKLVHTGVLLKENERRYKHAPMDDYYLPLDRQQEIIQQYCRRAHLTKRQAHDVSVMVNLGCSPSMVKNVRNKL